MASPCTGRTPQLGGHKGWDWLAWLTRSSIWVPWPAYMSSQGLLSVGRFHAAVFPKWQLNLGGRSGFTDVQKWKLPGSLKLVLVEVFTPQKLTVLQIRFVPPLPPFPPSYLPFSFFPIEQLSAHQGCQAFSRFWPGFEATLLLP